MKSVVQDRKECFVCHTEQNLHDHHIFFGVANRKLSERHGMKVWLCGYHHNLSDEGVHFNKELDQMLKEVAQMAFEKKLGSREEFMQIFGRNYL